MLAAIAPIEALPGSRLRPARWSARSGSRLSLAEAEEA